MEELLKQLLSHMDEINKKIDRIELKVDQLQQTIEENHLIKHKQLGSLVGLFL